MTFHRDKVRDDSDPGDTVCCRRTRLEFCERNGVVNHHLVRFRIITLQGRAHFLLHCLAAGKEYSWFGQASERPFDLFLGGRELDVANQLNLFQTARKGSTTGGREIIGMH